MPTATTGETTRDMRIMSALLQATRGETLGEFIAERRRAGTGWHSWEEIAYALRQIAGEAVTRETPRRWARKLGIPLDTRPHDGPELAVAYRNAVQAAGIKLPRKMSVSAAPPSSSAVRP